MVIVTIPFDSDSVRLALVTLGISFSFRVGSTAWVPLMP